MATNGILKQRNATGGWDAIPYIQGPAGPQGPVGPQGPAGTVDTELFYSKEETEARIQSLIGAAPAALDTLKELADALDNDANFASTIATQLNNKLDKTAAYVHPNSHAATMITQDDTHRFATDAEKTVWNNKAAIDDQNFNSNMTTLSASNIMRLFNMLDQTFQETVYNKTQIAALLEAKADQAATYTKTEVDEKIASALTVWTGTLNEYNALTIKSNQTIYFIKKA